ncbi:hypothetical protein K7X08_007683 [Anisodus acutangulus]|uniref:5-methyltetrahydropteroyltriglutamate--homocysteine S-methyltransferase n=1 Tax=Anisodus acutangulus TaxID=402998 RepID=A0A9Q1LFU7_9SOLA|nr:hypothetical protein K7X08_007683 [Anisodus acutangulus]
MKSNHGSAFAAQKVVEVNALAKALSGAKDEAFFSANAAAQASRKSSPRVTNETVQKASAALQGSDHRRATNDLSRRSTLNPSRRKSRRLLTFRKSSTLMSWFMESLRFETCYQIALAIKDEVEDLEKADINVIQIDEAALREGLPLRKAEHAFYLNWAVHSFRITNVGVQDTTQIHTHMCYSNFNDIIHSIIDMDADVITIENSRSDEKLLSVFREGVKYGAGIGPGVYDIHSPRIPSTEEIADRVNKMLAVLDTNILWVNPDCGLKTRKYTEVKPALQNMVSAAKAIRTQLASAKEVISELKAACASWIQFDEPTLVLDLEAHQLEAFTKAYAGLESTLSGLDVLVESYFADVPTGAFKTLTALKGVTAFGFDLVRGTQTLDLIKGSFPSGKYLFAGVVDGRNIWANDLAASLNLLQSLEDLVGKDKLVVSTSCSLLHTAVDLINEPKLDDEIKSWLAFAAQKVVEVNALAKALSGAKDEAFFSANASAQASRKSSPRVTNETVQKAEYVKSIKEEIKKVVDLQEELDIDVLVHGEPERNDMVEYFGEQLSGFAFTANGWVQSYGSRCVKPPIIYGDVSRPNPMTVFWSSTAQSMTKRPMKGMLTGPVTILNWSFVRNDQPRFETCYQIALAIKDEVEDLEKADINVIQIDEAALREGLPLRKAEHAFYLNWAVHSFRITNVGVQDTTQIHTHMCYSNFNDIIHSIIDMDADVITIENSRSDEKLLSVFREGVKYGAGIGPGVYDIHSPRIPSTEEIADRVNKMLAVLDTNILWVNPDCGLKTRKYTESSTFEDIPFLTRKDHCREVISELKAAGASWIQFDEPTLVLDLEAHQLEAFTKAYAGLESTLSGLDVLVESYFADVPTGAFKTLTALKGVTAFGFDLVRGTQTLDLIKGSFPSGKYLFAGVVDGRNIWANDLAASLNLLQSLEDLVGKGTQPMSPRCTADFVGTLLQRIIF